MPSGRVVLGDREQSAQRSGEGLVGGGLLFDGAVLCGLRDGAAGPGDLPSKTPLVGGVAPDGVHQVRDQVGSAGSVGRRCRRAIPGGDVGLAQLVEADNTEQQEQDDEHHHDEQDKSSGHDGPFRR